jgi:hypothetical protein
VFERSTFDLLLELLEKFVALPHGRPDGNITVTIRWLLDYRDFVGPHIGHLADVLLSLFDEKQITTGVTIFGKLRDVFDLASLADLHVIIRHPGYRALRVGLHTGTIAYERFTKALLRCRDDPECFAELTSLFEQSLSKRMASSAGCISMLAEVVDCLPENTRATIVEHVTTVLAWSSGKHGYTEEYLFALEAANIIGGITFSCSQILTFVVQSRTADLISPALRLIVSHCQTHPDEIPELRGQFHDHIMKRVEYDLTYRVYVPAVIRITLIGERPFEILSGFFDAWLCLSSVKVILTFLFTELNIHMCEVVRRLIMQMCGDLGWRVHLAERTGLKAFEAAVSGMSDDEALTVIGTIGGQGLVVSVVDWHLLAAVFRKRESQQATIREILRHKRPVSEGHIRAQITEIFASASQEDAYMVEVR